MVVGEVTLRERPASKACVGAERGQRHRQIAHAGAVAGIALVRRCLERCRPQ